MKCQNAFQSGAESSPKTLPFFQANSYSKFGLFGVETDWTGTLTWRWLARDYFSLLQFFWLTLVHTLSGAACIWKSHTLHCHTDVFARRSLWHSSACSIQKHFKGYRSVYFGYAMIYCSLDWCLFDSSIIQQVTCVKVTFAIWSSLLNNGVNTGVTSSQCSTSRTIRQASRKAEGFKPCPNGLILQIGHIAAERCFLSCTEIPSLPEALVIQVPIGTYPAWHRVPFESDRIMLSILWLSILWQGAATRLQRDLDFVSWVSGWLILLYMIGKSSSKAY